MISTAPPPPIVARRVNLDFGPLPEDDKPFDWYDGDAAQTEIFHALSITFPAGETFFIDSVLHYGARIKAKAPELWEQVRLFFRQEGMHTAVHEKCVFGERERERERERKKEATLQVAYSSSPSIITNPRHGQVERARPERVWSPHGRPRKAHREAAQAGQEGFLASEPARRHGLPRALYRRPCFDPSRDQVWS